MNHASHLIEVIEEGRSVRRLAPARRDDDRSIRTVVVAMVDGLPPARGVGRKARGRLRSPAPGSRDDAGFSIIEVVVAMVIFTIFVTAALGILLRTTEMARSNGQRGAATNLALRQIEAARAMSATDIPDGRSSSTTSVGGTTFTVTQTAKYVSSGATASACAGTGNTLAYKLITVSVSWPNMGSVKPVRSDTLRAVGIGNDVSDANKGSLAIGVVGGDGVDEAGVLVTLSPGGKTGTTTEDGCLVFTGLTPGAYTATASMPGYVGTGNNQTTTVTSLGVTAGAIAHGTLYYDTARTVTLAFTGTTGAVPLAGMPIRLGNTYFAEATFSACPGTPTSGCVTTVTPLQAKQLFPEQYAVKYGACTEVDPSRANVDLRPAVTGTTVTIPVATPTFIVKTASGAPIAGRVITITHGVGCTAVYTTTSVGGAGGAVAIPYGAWTISTPNASSVAVTYNSTALSSNKTATVTLTVSS